MSIYAKVRVVMVVMTVAVLALGLVVQGKEEVVVATQTPLKSLDPHARYSMQAMATLYSMYETLVHPTPGGEYVPWLAESWEQVDPLTWVFKLRKGVKFHNGNPFQADDVEYSYVRAATLPFSEMQFAAKKVQTITILDDYTVKFELSVPQPSLFYFIDRVSIMDKEWSETHGLDYIAGNANGTGPYKLVDWLSGSYLKLERYEDCWGEKPAFKRATVRPIAEHSTRVAELLTGNVDLINVPSDYIPQIEENPELKTVVAAVGRNIMLPINCAEGPTSSVKVRQALTMAINREELCEKVLGGYAEPTGQIVSPGMLGYNPDISVPEYNPERAKELLAEAGYPDGFTIPFNLSYDHYIKDEEIGVAVSVYFAKIGVDVRLRTRPWSAIASDVRQGKVDLYMIGWLPTPITASFTGQILCPDPEKGHGAWNLGYCNPEVDEFFEKAAYSTSAEEREELWQTANKIAMEEAAILPLYRLTYIYAMRKDLAFDVSFDGKMYVQNCSQ